MRLAQATSSPQFSALVPTRAETLITTQGDMTPECKETAWRAAVIAAAIIGLIAAIFYPWAMFALGMLLSVLLVVAMLTTPSPDQPGAEGVAGRAQQMIHQQGMLRQPGQGSPSSKRLDGKRPGDLGPLLRLPSPPSTSPNQSVNASSSGSPTTHHSNGGTPSMRAPAKHAMVGFRSYPSEPAQVTFSVTVTGPSNANGAHVIPGAGHAQNGQVVLPQQEQKAEALPQQPDTNQGLVSSTAGSTTSRGNVVPGMRGTTTHNNVIPGSKKA
jgi:hypothetical protein